MKFDIREIQALKKSGAKYNQYDEAVSRYLLALKIEGYDTSNIKNYEQLLELMNDYNVVYDKNIEGSIQSDIEKAVKEGISINKELLDDILMEYDKYLSVKQVKEKIRDDTYKTYQKIINNEKANKFAKDVAEKINNEIKKEGEDASKINAVPVVEEIVKDEISGNKNIKKNDIKGKLRDLDIKKTKEILNEEVKKILKEDYEKFEIKKREKIELEQEKYKKWEEKSKKIGPGEEGYKKWIEKKRNEVVLEKEEYKKWEEKNKGEENNAQLKKRKYNEWTREKALKFLKEKDIDYQKLVDKLSKINPNVDKEKLSILIKENIENNIIKSFVSEEFNTKVRENDHKNIFLSDGLINLNEEECLNKSKNIKTSINDIIHDEFAKNKNYKVNKDEEFSNKVIEDLNKKNKELVEQYGLTEIKKIIDERVSPAEFLDIEKLKSMGLSESEALLTLKKIRVSVDNYLKQNEEEAKLLRRDAFGKRLSDGFMGANEGFNMEQEIAFRKYRNFLANTFYPEDGFFESIGTKDWLNGYKEIKGDLIKSGLKLPYEMKEVADADNWARAFENPAILHQAVREQKTAQFWNNFNERTGGAFKNFGSNFQSGFNSFATQTRNGIGGAFNQFFGRKEGGGASPFMSGLKNIGNTLGQGAQNGARNALQGLNNGIGSMMKGLGGKLGGFGAKGGGMAAKGGLAAAKGLGALFAGGGGGIAIAVILIIILFVFILIYSGSLNQNLSSSLLPGAYGYQESDEDDEGGGEIVDGVCFVTRNGIKMPIFEPTTGGGRISTDTDGKRYDLAKKYPDFVGTTPSQYCYALENKFDSRVLPLLIKMIDDAKKDGIILGIDSMYRSYERQQVLYNAYVEYLSTGFCPSSECSCTCEPADPPGSSAHHTGRALDFNWWWTDGGSRYDWIKNNGYKYGFYQTTSEPWHWEYNPKLEAGESCEVETN